jgi:hypothetical protein
VQLLLELPHARVEIGVELGLALFAQGASRFAGGVVGDDVFPLSSGEDESMSTTLGRR